MKRAAWFDGWLSARAAAISLLALSTSAGPASAAIEYDFVYVDAFQSDYQLRESYLFDINNQDQACGFATDLPGYVGDFWSQATEKVRLPFTYARGINAFGQIVGLNRVFDRASETTTTIPVAPGAVATPMALDINDSGVVVGYDETCICSNSDRTLQIPFIWDAAEGVRTIAVPGAKELVQINNHSVAVGNIRGGSRDGFVYELGTGRTIYLSAYFPSTQYPWTEAFAVNDLGAVTGVHRSDDAQTYNGFVWIEATGARLLPHLEGQTGMDVHPWGINDAGVVVGMAEASDNVWHAFVYDATRGIRDLNSLVMSPTNFILDRALGINDRGWIIGDGHFGPNWSSSQAFVLIPREENVVAVTPPYSAGIDLRLRPNPSTGAVTLEYALEGAGAARITVFDLRGRKVATLLDRNAPGGRLMRWDGRDLTGRLVPSGAYLVRLETPGRTITRRLAIIR